MALLPRYLATTPPPRESGLARATDIGALTRTGDIEVWRGVSRFGGAIQGAGELGFDAYQRRRSLDDIIEEGIATQRAQESFNQAEDAAELIDVTADMPDPNDPDYMKTLTSFSTTKRDTLFADAVKDIEEDAKKLSQGFSNPANKARFENWYNKNYTRFADRVRHMYDAKLDAYQQAVLDKLVEDAAKNGDTKIANFYIDVMDKFELLTPQQAAARKEQVEKIAAESLALSYMNGAWEIATEMPYKDAITFLNNLPDIDKADRNDLIARRKRQNEIETVETDEIAKGQLEDMAYDVWSGAVSIEQMKTQLDTALGKTITTDDYDELWSLAQREHKAYQGKAMKTAIDDASRQLIDVRTDIDLLAAFAGITDKDERKRILSNRQLQMWNHAQYRKALNDWFKANPDANADEIYIQGQKLLVLYRGRRPDELKELLLRQDVKKGFVVLDPKYQALQEQRASEAAKRATDKTKSARIRVVSPTGETGTIPADQLDEALKAGYKEVAE